MDRRDAGFAGAAGADGADGGGITAAAGGGGATMAACAAREAGAVADGAVTLVAGTMGLPGTVGGTTAVCITGAAGAGGGVTTATGIALAGAAGRGGVTAAAGTTAVGTAGAAGAVCGGVTTVACIALAGAARRGAAAGTMGSPGAAGGGITLGARTALAGVVDGGGITMAAGTDGFPGGGGGGVTMAACAAREAGAVAGGGVTLAAGTARSPGAVGGAGVTLVTSTGRPDDGSAGGVDGSGAFWRRFGISAGFSTGGATWTSASGFALCAVSWRRRFGWAAACGAFAFPGLGSGLFFFCVSSVGNDFPRRGTPRESSQIHFAAPLPPWVRMRSLSSRRGNSSITHRGDKPASLASFAILIWRQARLGITMLGAGINSVNTPYNLASASGIRRSSHSIAISGAAGRNQIVCSGLGVELANAAPTWPT